MIDVDYNEYKETIAQNMKLIIENHNLKEEVERLKKELQALKMSEEEWLDESLGVDKNEKTS